MSRYREQTKWIYSISSWYKGNFLSCFFCVGLYRDALDIFFYELIRFQVLLYLFILLFSNNIILILPITDFDAFLMFVYYDN